jgi:hypothetical protein
MVTGEFATELAMVTGEFATHYRGICNWTRYAEDYANVPMMRALVAGSQYPNSRATYVTRYTETRCCA